MKISRWSSVLWAAVMFSVSRAFDAASAIADATANLEVARSSSASASDVEAIVDSHGNVAFTETKPDQHLMKDYSNSTARLANTRPAFNVSDGIVLETPNPELVELDGEKGICSKDEQNNGLCSKDEGLEIEEHANDEEEDEDDDEEEEEDDDPSNWDFVDEGETEDNENYDYFWIDMETGKLFENQDEKDLPTKASDIPKDQPGVSPQVLKALLEKSQAQEKIGEELWQYEFAEEDEDEDNDWDYFWIDIETGEIISDEEVEEEEEEGEEEWELVEDGEIEDPDYEYLYVDEDGNVDGPGAKFGVVQIVSSSMIEGDDVDLFNETAVLENLNKTEKYMKEIVWQQDSYEKVRDLCFNHYPLCSAWAAFGECDVNKGFMHIECAPSCNSCDKLHYETRCEVDPSTNFFQEPGDIHKMFERIVENDNYQPNILSQPQASADDNAPWIITIDDFFTAKEARHLIRLGTERGFERSTISGGVNEETGEPEPNVKDDSITSSSTWCADECDEDETVESLFLRMEELTGISFEHAEHLQLVKYEEGEYYLSHSDYVLHEQTYMAGPRVVTALMYFNEVEGGETYFNKLDVKIRPKMGRIAIWANVLNEAPDQFDERMEHEALPVIKGTKYIANSWHHLRSVQNAIDMGCT